MPTKTVNIFGNRTLDARPDRLDLRDRPYLPPVVMLPRSYPGDAEIRAGLPGYVGENLVLDQKAEGSCTGFGLACVIHSLLWRRNLLLGDEGPVTRVSTRMLYHLARFYDEWPGEDYDGSSCRGALKAWQRHGVCSEELWPYLNKKRESVFVPPSKGWERDAMNRRLGVYYRIDHRSVVDMQAALFEVGAIYVSAKVHAGWNVTAKGTVTGHSSLPEIRTRKESLGEHAFALVGYNPAGFVVQNSWGTAWGCQGFAILLYDDWVRHGTDAWVCSLGVPAAGKESSRVPINGRLLASTAGRAGSVGLGHRTHAEVSRAVVPWTLDNAFHHSIVIGNDGRPLNRIVTHENGADSVRQLVAVAPRAWLERRAVADRRILLYAHGGLNSEGESLNRIQVLAPYFEANGIYPLFLTWKTGLVETLAHSLEDALARRAVRRGSVRDRFKGWMEDLSDVMDRTVEVLAGPVAKPIWSQMKQNAEASGEDGRSTWLVARHLAGLAAAVSDLEIHLIGHSAGSILLGHFLNAAGKRGLTVRSCSLYAPACTVAFANDHYRRAVESDTLAMENLHVHVLSDAQERRDAVGPYRKSLLYLVSRALECVHKTPLLGLENTFSEAALTDGTWNDAREVREAVATWQAWWQVQDRNLHVVKERRLSSGTKGSGCKATHGCFDNHAETITATLTRILGSAPRHAIESLDY